MHRTACIKILSSFVSGKIAVQQCKGKKTIAIECSELFVVNYGSLPAVERRTSELQIMHKLDTHKNYYTDLQLIKFHFKL